MPQNAELGERFKVRGSSGLPPQPPHRKEEQCKANIEKLDAELRADKAKRKAMYEAEIAVSKAKAEELKAEASKAETETGDRMETYRSPRFYRKKAEIYEASAARWAALLQRDAAHLAAFIQ